IKPPSFSKLSCPTGEAPGQSPDGICAHNPRNWVAAAPKPTSTGAYPVGGFHYMGLYSCYAEPAVVTALAGTTVGSLGLWRWFFGSLTENGAHPGPILAEHGFAQAPNSWRSAAKKLLTTDQKTKIGVPGQVKTACAGITGPGIGG